MKRKIKPEQRKKFLTENIELNIEEEDNALSVKVSLLEIQQQSYPDHAKIILEAYNKINFERLELGKVEDYKGEKQSHKLPFDKKQRAKINFRLKIIDPNNYKLLGYAEGLKEDKYAKSLLDITTDDENVKNIYKIDFDNPAHPILYLNPKLAQCADKLKPILAEMALKDILQYLLFQLDDEEERREHKWFEFAERFSEYGENEKNADEKYAWINKILCECAEANNNKLIKSITENFKKND